MLALPVSEIFIYAYPHHHVKESQPRIIDIKFPDQYLTVTGRCIRSFGKARSSSICPNARVSNL